MNESNKRANYSGGICVTEGRKVRCRIAKREPKFDEGSSNIEARGKKKGGARAKRRAIKSVRFLMYCLAIDVLTQDGITVRQGED